MSHVWCDLIKSTIRPETRVLEPHSIVGSVFLSQVVAAIELVAQPSHKP